MLSAADLPHPPMLDAVAIDGLAKTPQHALAGERVLFAGEPLAIVLADSRYEAEDGAELVELEIDELPALVDVERARAGAPLHAHLASNVLYEATRRFGDVEAAFAAAHHVSHSRFHEARATAAPMEGRGCAASFDAIS